MKMDRILPTNDLAFKKTFTSNESKDILAGLINDFYLLNVNPEELNLETPYSIETYKKEVEDRKKKESAGLQYTIADIVASINNNNGVAAIVKVANFISEMQIYRTAYFEERFLYYAFDRFCKNYGTVTPTDDKIKRVKYADLCPVYALNILKQIHFEDDTALRVFQLYDSVRNKYYPKDLIRIGFFELSKPEVETVNQKHWQDYFNTGKANPDSPSYIIKASQMIEYVNLSEEEREMARSMDHETETSKAILEYVQDARKKQI